MHIEVHLSGRGYHLAEQFPDHLELAGGATVADAIEKLRDQDATQLLAPTCLVVLSGDHLGTVSRFEPRPLQDGDVLELIAPVAGG